MNDKPLVKSSLFVGAGGGALVIWLIGIWRPELVIPPEIAAIIAGLMGGVFGPIVRFFNNLLVM